MVVIVTAMLNGAKTRIAQHRSSLFRDNEAIPSWWPNERNLSLTKGFFQFVLVIAILVNCIILVKQNDPLYIVNFAILFMVMWPCGILLGIGCASGIIRLKGKNNNVRIKHECL